MTSLQSLDVFITNYVVHESKPYLFGVTSDGRTVGIRVMHFPFVLFIEPLFDAQDQDKTRRWYQDRVKPFLEANQRTSKFHRPATQIVSRKKLCGLMESNHWFVKAIYDSVADLRRDAGDITRKFRNCKVYHDRLDPSLVFTAKTGLRCFTWITCRLPSVVESHKLTRTDVEVMVDVKRISAKYTDDNDPANVAPPLRIAAFDIETDGLNWQNDQLRMISVNCDGKDFLLTRHPLDMEVKPDYEVIECLDEADLIRKFVDLVNELRPVFLTGWNIFRFDVRFVFERAKILDVFSYVESLSWLSTKKVQPHEKEMTSNAFGQNKVYHDDLEGLITLDGYILARKSMKMSSYSLKAFGEWLGDAKGDVSYEEMVEAFTTKDPKLLREVADYCVQDSRLVPKILKRMEEPDKVMAMTRLAGVPPVYTIKRGQSILTFGLIVGEAFARELVVNPPAKPVSEDGGYKGATVVDPIRGYHKDPVAVLDFESLYPSIMRAYNICVSTYVGIFPQKPEGYAWPAFSVIECEDTNEFVVFKKEGEEGVFPSILRVLLERRKAVKGRMKALDAKEVAYSQANALQLSLKVAANSMYGYLGASTSQIYEKALAASVTSMGRQSLWKVRSIIDGLRNASQLPKDVHVVYGDSVTGCTPLILRVDGVVIVTTMGELDGEWKPFGEGKEAFVPPAGGWEVWQDTGFTTVLKVIRHLVAKPLVRVITRRGLVDCTLDHSLISAEGFKVSPAGVGRGTELLHASFDALVDEISRGSSTNISPEKAFEMGVLGKIPQDLLYASKQAVEMFWEGFDPEQGYSTKARATLLYILGLRLGLSYRFECFDETSDLVRLVPDKADAGEFCVQEKWLLPCEGLPVMVYDLETASHHFGVGPGQLVVSNTDSVMVKFPGSSPAEADVLARFVEKECTKAFVAPMRLEYENLFVTYLLENKKRYAGRVWSPSGGEGETVIKGLCVKRRDFPRVVQRGLSGILDILLAGGADAPERALSFVGGILTDILSDKVDPADFCITKELGKTSYKTPPPHLVVSEKMARRNPHDPPKPGDRITFVVLSGSGNVSERVEAFEHVMAFVKNARFDTVYYADQLASQCKNMLGLCGMGKAFDEVLVSAKLKSQGQSRLTAFFRAGVGHQSKEEGEEDGRLKRAKVAVDENKDKDSQIKAATQKKQASLRTYFS
jgi:DNA polymerase elongation subunit (family B)